MTPPVDVEYGTQLAAVVEIVLQEAEEIVVMLAIVSVLKTGTEIDG
jgi:hypothetical protein